MKAKNKPQINEKSPKTKGKKQAKSERENKQDKSNSGRPSDTARRHPAAPPRQVSGALGHRGEDALRSSG